MPVPVFKVRAALLHSETHFLNFDLNYWLTVKDKFSPLEAHLFLSSSRIFS